MPILDIQMRMRELGRIRIGQKGAKGAPTKLDRFRFTSPSQTLVEQVAVMYGGTAVPWKTPDGRDHHEVVSDATRVPVLLPPQPVSQWMELWSGGGCQRRCDGVRETLTDAPCVCKANEDDDGCKPTTRLNVILRDLPGLGVWRLESHGWNAALELPAAAEFAARANGMIPAFLTLEERVSKDNGQTRRYMVPGLDVDISPTQLLAGEGVLRPLGVNGGGERRELEASETAQPVDWIGQVPLLRDLGALHALWDAATDAGAVTEELKAALVARAAELRGTETSGEVGGEAADPGEPVGEDGGSASPTGETAERQRMWGDILNAAGANGRSTVEVRDEFAKFADGQLFDEAPIELCREYHSEITGGAS